MGPHSHPPSALSQDVPRVPNAATLRPPLEEAEAMKAALRDAQSETLHFKKEIRSSVAELADRCTLPPPSMYHRRIGRICSTDILFQRMTAKISRPRYK